MFHKYVNLLHGFAYEPDHNCLDISWFLGIATLRWKDGPWQQALWFCLVISRRFADRKWRFKPTQKKTGSLWFYHPSIHPARSIHLGEVDQISRTLISRTLGIMVGFLFGTSPPFMAARFQVRDKFTQIHRSNQRPADNPTPSQPDDRDHGRPTRAWALIHEWHLMRHCHVRWSTSKTSPFEAEETWLMSFSAESWSQFLVWTCWADFKYIEKHKLDGQYERLSTFVDWGVLNFRQFKVKRLLKSCWPWISFTNAYKCLYVKVE